ncbi:unnamed protein product [Symbiodinium natans]|uniref:Uncharacterized protein n=1 Tax=Symbiodinium natans TaxID=878477 RepID=A0A812VBF0_9DINO|nr:unnamed protein product [Symbiodinium natans]
MENGQDDVPISVRKLTLTKELKDDIENGTYEEGWFYLTDGRPVRLDWDVNTTYSLGKDEGKSFKYRTTLRTRYEEEQIVWEELEFYECAEEWREKSTMVIVPETEKSVVITIMERFPRSVEDYGEYSSPYKRKEAEEKRDVEMEPQEQEDLWKGRSEEELQREIDKGVEELAQAPGPEQHLQEENDESERKKVEEQLPKLGEAMDERMKIGGIELTPASTLKQLRHACEFLKANVIEWNRSGADRRTASTSPENSSSWVGDTAVQPDSVGKTKQRNGEEEPEGTSKRELEGGAAEEPEATRPRVEEGSGQVEERAEKIQRGEPSGTVRRIMATRSVQEVASFLRKDLPKYHDDEEVELEEFEGLEVELEESEEEEAQSLERMKSSKKVCRSGRTSSKMDLRSWKKMS